MDHADPFLQVQADVLSTLNTTRPLFSSYLRIRSLAKSPSNPELQQARSELETTLTDLTADLDDLVESVRAVEQDPYRFGLDIEEVQRRRKLVDDVGKEIEEMRGELVKVITNTSSEADAGKNKGGLPHPGAFDDESSGLNAGSEQGDDYYAAIEQQRQMELMHEQDEQLDGVFRTVGNLRQQADDMGRELEEQAVMIGEVDTLADRVGGKLQNGMSRLKHIIRKNEGKYSFCHSLHCINQSDMDGVDQMGSSKLLTKGVD
ncbi:SNARE domain protein [Aspergillus undulatus]|uniref:SNARE domain protein n=1 Tax=Aspergillus undulatus TaxID=1810928 RepID=UPI003CCCE0C5